MNVLILEPYIDGHHANYLKWLLREIRRRKWRAILATTRQTLSDLRFKEICAEADDIRICELTISDSPIFASHRYVKMVHREWTFWRAFQKAVARVAAVEEIGAIILPYLEYCFYAIAFFGAPFSDIPWCAISMRLTAIGRNSGGLTGGSKKWRFAKRILGSKNLKAFFVINPSVVQFPPSWLTAREQLLLCYLPDPAELALPNVRNVLRQKFRISETAVVILVYGYIDERKGITSLLEAVAQASNLDDVVVFIAGIQSKSFGNTLKSGRFEKLIVNGKLMVLNQVLNDELQGQVFAVSDAVWLGYRNHRYMSGVMVLAGQASLPVIGANFGEIGYLISRYNFGIAVDIDQANDIAVAIDKLLNKESRQAMGNRGHSLFSTHTVENFGVTVLGSFDN